MLRPIRTVICMATRWQSGLHHPVSVYAKQVTQGRLRAQCCKYEILACQRHLDDLKRQGTEGFPYVFDTTRADRIVRWFGQCIQVRGVDAGKPIKLEPWQVFDLGCTYGWVHKDTGARRFTHTYNKRARGNYKSSEKSCQGLYHMCGDAIYPPYRLELARFEQEPEVECAAVDRGQAMRVLGDAKKIALNSPSIARRLLVPRSNPIVHRTRGGSMRALSKDTKNKDSGAPTYFVVDEYHAHPNSEIYDLGTNSFGKRAQSLLDVITTAGDDAGNKPCYEEELYAKRVLEDPTVTDESYFVMIRELDEGDSPHDEGAWAKPNPCLRFPSQYSEILLKQIRDEHNAAYVSNDPNKIRKFLTRRMCLWQVGSVNRYLDERCMALAKRAMVPREAFADLTDGLRCHCGFDLGKRIDLSGAAAVFDLPDGRVAIKMHGFMPENGADRHEKSDRVPYQSWAQGGYCTLTPGDVTDNGYVYSWICEGEREPPLEGGRGGLRRPQRHRPGHPHERGQEPGGLLRGGGPDLRRAEPGGEDLPGAAAPGEGGPGGEPAGLLVPGQRHRDPEQLRGPEALQAPQGRHGAHRPGGRRHERPGPAAGEAVSGQRHQ